MFNVCTKWCTLTNIRGRGIWGSWCRLKPTLAIQLGLARGWGSRCRPKRTLPIQLGLRALAVLSGLVALSAVEANSGPGLLPVLRLVNLLLFLRHSQEPFLLHNLRQGRHAHTWLLSNHLAHCGLYRWKTVSGGVSTQSNCCVERASSWGCVELGVWWYRAWVVYVKSFSRVKTGMAKASPNGRRLPPCHPILTAPPRPGRRHGGTGPRMTSRATSLKVVLPESPLSGGRR